jgi:hypothetical protein
LEGLLANPNPLLVDGWNQIHQKSHLLGTLSGSTDVRVRVMLAGSFLSSFVGDVVCWDPLQPYFPPLVSELVEYLDSFNQDVLS